MRLIVVVAACLALGPASVARAVSVEKLLGGGRLVAYAPPGADPSSVRPPDPARLRADAERLHLVGFRAVATYGSSRALAPICRFFKRRGFTTVLVGVWDPRDANELRRARALRKCADGYVVGSGGLAAGRYERAELERAVGGLRQATGRPVTTRETLESYAADATLLRLGDWVFPIIQPWFAGHRESQDACGWTIFAYRDLAARAPAGVPTVIGATGLPTAGGLPTSEHYQRAFFYCLESRRVAFAYFEGFDQPGTDEDGVAAHWGVFRADGSPKLWAAQQILPVLTVRRTARAVRGRLAGVPAGMLRVVVYGDDPPWTRVAVVAPGRRGKWRVRVPAGRRVVVYAATTAWAAPEHADRLPSVDRAQILVQRDVPPV